jgi:DNA-binding NarL/FixJ family response regulator
MAEHSRHAVIEGGADRSRGSETDRTWALDAADRLTPREREILGLLAHGAGTRAISEHLRISPNTVRSHVQALLWKLGVDSRLRAVALALRHGLVSIPGRGVR